MGLELLTTHADRAYPILAEIVTPRPIAWVTTLNEDGKVNAAPFSFFNMMDSSPPLVVFAPGDRDNGSPKDTARNAQRTDEFVVNLVDEPLAAVMNRTSASLPYGTSETEVEKLETAPSSVVAPPPHHRSTGGDGMQGPLSATHRREQAGTRHRPPRPSAR